MSNAKDHHYIPRFLLKNFIDPETPHGHDPFLWFFDPEKSNWEARAPHNVASDRYLYGFQRSDGTYDTEWERWHSQVENAGARAVRQLRLKRELTVDDQENFAIFVAAMHLRCPDFQRLTQEFLTRSSEVYMSMMMHGLRASPKAFEAHKKRWVEKSGDSRILPLSIDEFETALEGATTPMKFDVLNATMAGLHKAAEFIINMDWHFAFCKDDNFFILSDRPCSVVNRRSTSLNFCGFENPDAELILPIASDLVFRAIPGTACRRWADLAEGAVASINITTARWGTGEIYSPKPNFPGADRLNLNKISP